MKKYFILILALILLSISTQGALTDTLTHYYSFDEDATDGVGSNDGVVVNAYRNTTGGILGGYYDFTGTASYINLGDLDDTMVIGSDFTINMWIKYSALSDKRFMGYYHLANGDRIDVRINSGSDLINFGIGDDGASGSVKGGTLNSLTNEWFMMTYIFNKTNNVMALYINNAFIQSASASVAQFDNHYNFSLGGIKYQLDSFADINIDEFSLYSSALTNDLITELYNGGAGYNPIALSLPFVNITTPANNTNINSETKIIYNLDDGGEASTCKFLINDSLKVTQTKTTGLYNFSFNSSVWGAGYNLINVSCNNSVGSSSDLIYLFVDTINPVINYAKVCQGSDGLCFNINGSTIDENLIMNISVSDSNLYSINVTWFWATNTSDVEYSDRVTGINGTNYIYNKIVDLGLFDELDYNYSVFIEVCDAHTTNLIADLPIIDKIDSKTIDKIDFKPITGGVLENIFTKEVNKYTFDYTIDKTINDLEIKITSPDYIDIIKNSNYKGHLVTAKKWIDFEDGTDSTITFNRISNNEINVLIHSKTARDYFKFSSIGQINCINQTLNAEVQAEEGRTNASSPADNTRYVVYDTYRKVNFSYYPYYLVAPDNCSLWIDGVKNQTDITISKNVLNYFLNIKFPSPLAQQSDFYDFQFKCSDLHLHPPQYSEEHTTISETRTLEIFNNATTTTTTSTTSTSSTTTTTQKPAQTDALNCSFNSFPYLKEKIILSDRDLIKWFCTFNNSNTKKCITFVKRGEDLVQTNPSREMTEYLGVIDYFEGNGFVNAYFDGTDLIPGFKYNFTISCFNEYTNQTITNTAEIQPTNKPLQDYTIPRVDYFKTGAVALVLIIILISMIIFIKKVVLK